MVESTSESVFLKLIMNNWNYNGIEEPCNN